MGRPKLTFTLPPAPCWGINQQLVIARNMLREAPG
jgi:hypothetical protein